MASKDIKRIGILTGGGDCPGLNAVIRAVVKNANENKIEVIGFKDGFLGLVQNSTKVLGKDDVSNILILGGTILGSSNKDNPFGMLEKDAKGMIHSRDRSDEAVANIKKHGVEVLVVLGGDGSMTIADKLARKGVRVVGVPKTIDNDLVGTDQTFGHDTAVHVATEAIDRLHTTADSHHRVMVVEVMGRYAGWLALQSGLASGGDVILIPEIPFDVKKIVDVIAERYNRGRNSSIIVVAEGAFPRKGKMTVDRVNPLSPEKIRLGGVSRILAKQLEEMSGLEARAVILGHIVRGGTPTSYDRILATLFGVKAMDLVLKRNFGRMVTLKKGAMSSVPLSEVGGKIRGVPQDHVLLKTARKIGVSFGV